MTTLRNTILAGPVVLALCVLLVGCSKEELEGGAPLHPYPLDRCLVSDEKLGADPAKKTYVFVQDGQEIKLCCEDCLKDFKKNPQLYLAKLPPAVPEGRVQP